MNIYTFDSEEEMVKLASIRMLLNKIQTVSEIIQPLRTLQKRN